ncbi:putative pentatricopeptide repeat-containing protein [Camellia lanceoleosa]|uniref:Pentatricopeptide repeat-containing protein n=1 Tax=Camellia lanceoleosa TaxID=1840588 RepID=A0ACC0FV04_9ERIC|nr:putative pentatricopeptide repeat-containing protein [Camellia lanceoleosa]
MVSFCSIFMKPLSIPNLLSACKSIRNLEQVHTQIIHKGAEQDHFVITRFISLTSLFSNISYASNRFDRFCNPISIYGTLSSKSANTRLSHNVSDSWVDREVLIEHDVFVGSSLVDMYGKCGEIEFLALRFLMECVRNEVSWTSMIVGYVNAGDLIEAKKLFDVMPKRNMVSWNAMISGFVRFGDLKSARKLFDEMPERNVVSFHGND